MEIIIIILLIIAGIYWCIVLLYSKLKSCSLDKADKDFKDFIFNEILEIPTKQANDAAIMDFINEIWIHLKAVDEIIYNKIQALAKLGTQVYGMQDKGDSIYNIKMLYPCMDSKKAEVEAIIRGIANNHGIIIIDCTWEQVIGLEAVCITIDASGGNSEIAKKIILKKQKIIIDSLKAPEEDYDDEL